MKILLRILVVEDSEDDALLVMHQVKKGGYDIYYERVETAEKMNAALREKTWDIILSDYQMPHFNGLEALILLREMGIDIPFIIISGTIGEEVAVEAMKAGAHDYLMKYNLKRLLPAIERELRESRIRAEQKLLEQKQKKAEEDRLAHIRFIESMDHINLAILGSSDLEKMMKNVLETMLSIFDCDRAWLFYPCDPEAPTFQVPMEITRPEYPGANILNMDIPMPPDMAGNLREALDSTDPVTYTIGTDKPINKVSAEQFGVQSQMFVALYPKTGKPWVFGMHQCSYARIWTMEERRLFQEIGRRLSDSLTSLLMYRNLCSSEAENRAIVDTIPDLLFRIDKDGIIADFRKPENMELYVPPNQFLGRSISEVLPSNVSYVTTPAIEKALKTNEIVTFEYDLLINGQTNYYEGRMIAFSKDEVLILVRNITKRKHTELEISRVNRALRILSDSNQALIHITDERKLLNEVCRIVVEVGGYRMAWVGFAEHDEAKTLRPVAYAGFESGYIESAHVTWADNERGRGPGGTAIRTGQACIARDIPSDPYFAPWRKAALQRGYKSIIALPLKSQGETLGAMGIYSDETDVFDVKEVEILQELADDLVFGITALRTRVKREIAEKALIESEERFRLIAEHTADTISVLDFNLHITYVSPSVRKLRGFSAEEAITQSMDQIFTPQSLQKVDTLFAEQMALEATGKADPTRTESLELEEYCKDGSTIWVDIAISFIRDDNLKPTGILTVTRDISERKRAEENLRILSRAVEQSPASIIITDTEGKISYVNPKFTEVTGYTANEVLGQNPRILKSGEQPPEYYQHFWQTLTFGKVWYGEFHNRKKNGELFWELASVSPIFDTTGTITHFLAVKEDITTRKQTELELIKAKEKAEESDRLKSAFLANLSHEIRTPMNGILGFAELLKEPYLTGTEHLKYITIIEKSGARMLNIINDIVDISKIESGQMKVTNSITNINEQIEYIYAFFKPEAEKKGLQFFIKKRLATSETTVITDREKVNAVLTNIVKNAIKYTMDGSIILGCEKKGNDVVFCVKDTGIGIPKNRQEAIFDRFVQADIEDKKALQGAGLGLSISKAYVEMLGGKIWVTSEEKRGTSFYFTIPYIITPEIGMATPNVVLAPDLEGRMKNLKILIAEDEETSDLLITLAIENISYCVLHAKTGREALEICQSNPDIDLVLMDIKMPDINGYEATRQIRRFNKDVVIIAQTAYAQIGDRENAIVAGCNDYISKPINIGYLKELIRKCFKIQENGNKIV